MAGWINLSVNGLGCHSSRNGNDMADVYEATMDAVTYSRKRGSPACNIQKYLDAGHAATDRQAAYLDNETIQNAYMSNPCRHMLSSYQ